MDNKSVGLIADDVGKEDSRVDNEQNEVYVVSASYAVVQPVAMMVEALNADATLVAMFGVLFHANVALRTEVASFQILLLIPIERRLLVRGLGDGQGMIGLYYRRQKQENQIGRKAEDVKHDMKRLAVSL